MRNAALAAALVAPSHAQSIRRVHTGLARRSSLGLDVAFVGDFDGDGVDDYATGGEKLTCDVAIPIETFSEAADLAGISRVLGGYHIQADNVAGLQLGRDVAEYLFPKLQAYFRGELP